VRILPNEHVFYAPVRNRHYEGRYPGDKEACVSVLLREHHSRQEKRVGHHVGEFVPHGPSLERVEQRGNCAGEPGQRIQLGQVGYAGAQRDHLQPGLAQKQVRAGQGPAAVVQGHGLGQVRLAGGAESGQAVLHRLRTLVHAGLRGAHLQEEFHHGREDLRSDLVQVVRPTSERDAPESGP